MSKLLSLDKIPSEVLTTELVEVPEFGYEDGEAYAVRARAMTVEEFNLVVRRSYTITPAQENGESPSMEMRGDFDEVCLIAAWCSLDDDDNLVFGKTKRLAEQRVRNMPHKYAPAIMRIYSTVLRLSHISRRTEDGETESLNDAERLEEASKN